MKILYSQSWEDPLVLNAALRVGSDDAVLSITSSGDNTLFLLSKNPGRLVAIDSNPAQNYLLELKARGIQFLDHGEFLEFTGALPSARRLELYGRIGGRLSPGAAQFWAGRPSEIRKGIIHCGKFERYLGGFRKYILPLSQSRGKIDAFLGLTSLGEQKEFYERAWDNLPWRLTFKIFFSEFFLRNGRDAAFFKHHRKTAVAGQYLRKTKKGFTEVPLGGNYFLHYILKGNYHPACLPEYLEKENFARIKANLGRLEIITCDIGTYLAGCPEGRFSKFNLSDIFELVSREEYVALLQRIIRVSRDGGSLCYWNHLVERNEHPELGPALVKQRSPVAQKAGDRVFFYDDFICESVRKPGVRKERSTGSGS
ncbi:MAG TPA: DUF3419 family protein [Elusimicrobiales bacterium]|nr:DUF3419 family protein [Elusimicrobiales bacterium]